MKSRIRELFCVSCVSFLTACAFQNKQIQGFHREPGYRLPTLKTNELNTDEVFVILSFPGGGTRAAAFSFGAMKELQATSISRHRNLLDEVDIISSVSGGSFTSAYYALYRDVLFNNFEKEFLDRNVQLGLALRVLNPINWPRLISPRFDRIDLAAEYYDTLLFKQKTTRPARLRHSSSYQNYFPGKAQNFSAALLLHITEILT